MIDSHAHLWRLGENGCTWPTADLPAIHRDFRLEDLRAVAVPAGIDGVVLVQSQPDARDTDWLLSLADDPLIAGIVGWVDFELPGAAVSIIELAKRPVLRGLRPMVQDKQSDWYDTPSFDAAFAATAEGGLVLDALVRPRHLPSLHRLAERHPNLSIVIDHGAKPDFADFASWSEWMTRLSRPPNVSCKFSGLLTELPKGAPAEAIAPAFKILWNAFGNDRLIWGSDWPVLTLAGSYGGWLSQALRLVPDTDHERVFDLNARRVYGLAA
jgi:L-fuconolactonase